MIMKKSYPILLTEEKTGFTVYIPDFDINTQGKDLTNAIEMARDAIGLLGIDMEDENKTIPEPSPIKSIKSDNGVITSLVDVDFTEYRRKNEMRAVKKNCTIPSWLSYEAEKANLNFSQILQSALKKELRITDR